MSQSICFLGYVTAVTTFHHIGFVIFVHYAKTEKNNISILFCGGSFHCRFFRTLIQYIQSLMHMHLKDLSSMFS